ncbi:hypothetical protein [Nonomuraea roseoviolacea]|uniref:Transposase n=1 Tax=Nonomuraea roseoviolacea subsp. carminata TaxID=160689 RepID=A0ABT1K9Y3_9ACTN|nr:hypothetical protein [Nonomuraea roseoviolacea]MCP2350818.1 hypothetical protein [Nonomuraea roseoviolacea subsp. carminata]
MDLDEVADRLYGLPPSEFTAAREAEARAAKDAGDAKLSREIGRLRKPTVSAWAVNRAAREHPDDLRELLEVGEELRRAWAAHDAEALAEVARRRGAVAERVGRLVKEDMGLSAAASVEVDRTLDAAVVDEGAAAEVRQGRLVRPLEYSGFAPAPAPARAEAEQGEAGAEGAGVSGTTSSTSSASGSRSPAGAAGRPAREVRASRKAAAEERARREAEARAAREARRAQERMEAEATYLEWREALTEAVREHDKRAEKVARLERKLTKARAKLRESEQRLEVARREERHARRRLEG